MGNFRLIIIAAVMLMLFSYTTASAHFGIVIPSSNIVMDKGEISLDIAFSHPSAGVGMDMEKPVAFSVCVNGQSSNLMDSLKEGKFLEHKAWTAGYNISKPGVYQFAVTPAPYFEAAEDSFIIHYAKTVVASFGAEDGWDEPLGLPVEIVPLTRPFGNFTGNVFVGKILKNGKPVPNATVEMESFNQFQTHKGPNDYYQTQVIKADENGVFTAGIPWAGWWGFAALTDGDESIMLNGQQKTAELGGIIWVYYADPIIVK